MLVFFITVGIRIWWLLRSHSDGVHQPPRLVKQMRISKVRGLSRALKEIEAGAPFIPKTIVDRIANGDDPPRVLRKWREMTQLYL